MKKIKCLICSEEVVGFKNLKDHYSNQHNIKEDNTLFIKYLISLKKPSKKHIESCPICGEILESNRNRTKHLLKNHNNLLEESIKNLPIITKHDTVKDHSVYTAKIYRNDHFYDYDWNNTGLIQSFLDTARISIDSLRIVENNKRISINVNFGIVNKNINKVIPLYLPVRSWSTKSFISNYIDEITIFALGEEIKLRIIQNGENSSSIIFSHFTYMEMVVTDISAEDVKTIFGGDDSLKKKENKVINLI